jgi:crotonobetainyl-CoA:carnitine CoA-transferase CaiB-like acyl-CoA transferase
MSDSAPLTGLKVLDLSRVLSGPYCTQLMADMGADVIKVEPPHGDDTRRFGPPFVEGESTYFLSINRGKRSLCLNLKKPKGRAAAQGLARWADVVVENFRPGVADKLGVGYSELKTLNAALVYVSISGFGHRGQAPFTSAPGYDLVIQGLGGIPALTGPADGPPYKMGTSVADLVSGLNAYAGVMTALVQRNINGQGRHVDIAMLDGQLSLLSYHASAWLNAQARPTRLGNAHPSICPYETFAAKDGYFNIGCGNDKQFEKLSIALEMPQWFRDTRFATNADRVANRHALLAKMEPLFEGHNVAHWIDLISAKGVPCGPIYNVPQALSHPQAEARKLIINTEHPSLGQVRTIGAPLGFEPSYTTRPPPLLGQHSVEILSQVLAWSEAEITKAKETGAVITLD